MMGTTWPRPFYGPNHGNHKYRSLLISYYKGNLQYLTVTERVRHPSPALEMGTECPAQLQNAIFPRGNSCIQITLFATLGSIVINWDHAHLFAYASDSDSIMKSSGVDDRSHERQSQDVRGSLMLDPFFAAAMGAHVPGPEVQGAT